MEGSGSVWGGRLDNPGSSCQLEEAQREDEATCGVEKCPFLDYYGLGQEELGFLSQDEPKKLHWRALWTESLKANDTPFFPKCPFCVPVLLGLEGRRALSNSISAHCQQRP